MLVYIYYISSEVLLSLIKIIQLSNVRAIKIFTQRQENGNSFMVILKAIWYNY